MVEGHSPKSEANNELLPHPTAPSNNPNSPHFNSIDMLVNVAAASAAAAVVVVVVVWSSKSAVISCTVVDTVELFFSCFFSRVFVFFLPKCMLGTRPQLNDSWLMLMPILFFFFCSFLFLSSVPLSFASVFSSCFSCFSCSSCSSSSLSATATKRCRWQGLVFNNRCARSIPT